MKSKDLLHLDAISIRRKLGEDNFSPVDVFALISSLDNFTLIFYPFSDRISGMSIKNIDNKENVIAINSRFSYGRQRYTAAHELYHLFVQENFNNTVCIETSEGKSDVEKEADAFASYFLMTKEALRFFVEEKINSDRKLITLYDILRIEQYFQMSHQATLIRVKEEGYITSSLYEEWRNINVRNLAALNGFDVSLYMPKSDDSKYSTIGNYIKLAEKLKDNEVISEGKYDQYLLDAFRPDIVYNLGINKDEIHD